MGTPAKIREYSLIIGVIAMIAATAGCSGATHTPTDTSQVVDLPERYSVSSEGEALTSWCSDFDTAELDGLIERALDANFTLRAGFARLEQARALARQAGALQWPQVDLQVQAGHARTFAPPPVGSQTNDRYSASLPAAYEVDLWGRIGATANAAELDALAGRDEVEALAISIAAQVTEAWLDIVEQRALIDLLERQLATNEQFLQSIYRRMGYGVASAPDIYQQQQQVDAILARLELARAGLELSEQRLAVLLGDDPQARLAGQRAELPELPPPPAIGVPADLLDNRPDVRAARRRVEAADWRTAAAIADRLPSLRLTGSLSIQALTPETLLEELFWSIGAGLTQSLFDGGRRSAEVDRAEAVTLERLYTYAQTLLTAMQEVEGALVLERQQLAYIEALDRQYEGAVTSLELESDRYVHGLSDYLRVLVSLQATQRLEQARLEAQRQLLSYRVQLCRAVGGDWTRTL